MDKVRELTGLSKSTISDSENPEGNPTENTLQKLAKVYGVEVDDFYKDYSEEDISNKKEDPDIQLIQRAHKKMDSKQREKMMDLLKLSFDDLFDEESDD